MRVIKVRSLIPVRLDKYLMDQFPTLGLGRRVEHPHILQAVEPYPGRWTHHVLVTEADQIDEELMGWLREAWDFAESKR